MVVVVAASSDGRAPGHCTGTRGGNKSGRGISRSGSAGVAVAVAGAAVVVASAVAVAVAGFGRDEPRGEGPCEHFC